MASQPIRFLPLRPESAVAALEWFPPVATRSQPLQRRVIRLFPLRDQGVAGSNPVLPDQHSSGWIRSDSSEADLAFLCLCDNSPRSLQPKFQLLTRISRPSGTEPGGSRFTIEAEGT